jgi:hypothetical protein
LHYGCQIINLLPEMSMGCVFLLAGNGLPDICGYPPGAGTGRTSYPRVASRAGTA